MDFSQIDMKEEDNLDLKDFYSQLKMYLNVVKILLDVLLPEYQKIK